MYDVEILKIWPRKIWVCMVVATVLAQYVIKQTVINLLFKFCPFIFYLVCECMFIFVVAY